MAESEKVQSILFEAKVNHVARLFRIVTNTYGLPKQMKALDKIEGQEIVAVFPKLRKMSSALRIHNQSFHPLSKPSKTPNAQVIFNLEENEIVPVINDVLRTKANLLGLAKLVVKYVLTGRIKLQGNIKTALIVIKSIMIKEHPMYSREIELGRNPQ